MRLPRFCGTGGRFAGSFVYKPSGVATDRRPPSGLKLGKPTFSGKGRIPPAPENISKKVGVVSAEVIDPAVRQKAYKTRNKKLKRMREETEIDDIIQKLNVGAPKKPKLARPSQKQIKTVTPSQAFNLTQMLYKPVSFN